MRSGSVGKMPDSRSRFRIVSSEGLISISVFLLGGDVDEALGRAEKARQCDHGRGRRALRCLTESIEALQHDPLDTADVDETEGQRASAAAIERFATVTSRETQKLLCLPQSRPRQRAGEQLGHEAAD